MKLSEFYIFSPPPSYSVRFWIFRQSGILHVVISSKWFLVEFSVGKLELEFFQMVFACLKSITEIPEQCPTVVVQVYFIVKSDQISVFPLLTQVNAWTNRVIDFSLEIFWWFQNWFSYAYNILTILYTFHCHCFKQTEMTEIENK